MGGAAGGAAGWRAGGRAPRSEGPPCHIPPLRRLGSPRLLVVARSEGPLCRIPPLRRVGSPARPPTHHTKVDPRAPAEHPTTDPRKGRRAKRLRRHGGCEGGLFDTESNVSRTMRRTG